MNKKYAKIAAAMAGIMLMTVALLPLAATEVVAAKWFGSKEKQAGIAQVEDETTGEEEAVPAYKVIDSQDPDIKAVEEAIVVKANGEEEQIAVVEAADQPVNVDMVSAEELNSLQKQVDADQKVWLLDPVLVLKAYNKYSLDYSRSNRYTHNTLQD